MIWQTFVIYVIKIDSASKEMVYPLKNIQNLSTIFGIMPTSYHTYNRKTQKI